MNKRTQKTLFSSAKQDWETPQWLFDELNAKYGPFDLDVCASFENHKCAHYLSSEVDGLKMPWEALAYRCWMNPPYGREIGKWVKKAYEESRKGCLVVALLPARTCTSWFHDYIYNREGVTFTFLRGRLTFVGAEAPAPFPSLVVVFNPPGQGPTKLGCPSCASWNRED